MRDVKRHRLEELQVKCHPGTMVGEYVPFYFCPRSIMLYILHMGNHPSIDYSEGQRPILHLTADLGAVIRWAHEAGRLWAFSDRNAGARIAQFYRTPESLDRIDWEAVAATDFRTPIIRDGKQAEFLLHESFPWALIERIGVIDETVAEAVRGILGTADHQPAVVAERIWYY